MKKSVEAPKKDDPVATIIAVAIIVALGFGGYKIYEVNREKRIAREKHDQEVLLAHEQAQAKEAARIAAEKKNAIKSADRDTLSKLVSSCRSAITDLVSKGPFGVNFPYYSPADLDQFAGIGAAFGKPLGWPSAALDNYDFDAVGWNLERIAHKEFPISDISFVVEGSQDGFSVRQYAAVYSCSIDGLAITEPTRTQIYYLD